MGSMSIWHWLIVGAVVLLLFGGKGKISDIMGDMAKGVKSFKKGLAEDDTTDAAATPTTAPRALDARGLPVETSETRKVG
jgi:sec-independent protein translocase protein TatA